MALVRGFGYGDTAMDTMKEGLPVERAFEEGDIRMEVSLEGLTLTCLFKFCEKLSFRIRDQPFCWSQ